MARNAKTPMAMQARKGAVMPECRFGAACTRPDCIYRHPPKGKKAEKVRA